MSDDNRVRVAFYWGGQIISENNTVDYSERPRAIVKLSPDAEYDWLVRNLHIRMKTNPDEVTLVISERWPHSTVQDCARYIEFPIVDTESLKDFLSTSDTVRYMMNLNLLEMYIKTEPLEVNDHHVNEPYSEVMSVLPEFSTFTSLLTQCTSHQNDLPSRSQGQGYTDYENNFFDHNNPCYDFRDGAGPSRTLEPPEIRRVSEIQARVEADHHADQGDDDSEGDAPNDEYDSDEIASSGEESGHDDDEQHPAEEVPNIPLYGEHNPFLYDLQGRPEVFASTRESEGVQCRIWMDDNTSDLEAFPTMRSRDRTKSVA